MGRKCSSHFGCSPHLQGNPCQQPHLVVSWPTRPCPDRPPLSSLIRTQLSPRSLSQRHFWKHRCQRGRGGSRPCGTTATRPGTQAGLQRRPLRPRLAGRTHVAPLLLSVPLAVRLPIGCQTDTQRCGRYCISWPSAQSVQFMPFRLPPESSTLHIKNVPSRMQCKQCRRKVQPLGEAGMSWEASPYTWGARGGWERGLPGAQSPPSVAALGGWGEGEVGQAPLISCPSTGTCLGACAHKWANGGGQGEGAGGTRQPPSPAGSWEAAPGSWPGATAARPRALSGKSPAGLTGTAPVSHPLLQGDKQGPKSHRAWPAKEGSGPAQTGPRGQECPGHCPSPERQAEPGRRGRRAQHSPRWQ